MWRYQRAELMESEDTGPPQKYVLNKVASKCVRK